MEEPVPSADIPAPAPIICPNCGAPIDVAPEAAQPSVHCPFCELDFVPAPADVSGDPAVDWPEEVEPESELDGLKIRKLVQTRRAAIRARTYAVVVLVCCLVMGGQLIFTDIQEVGTYGWDRWAILYAISAGAMVIGATIASRKAAALHRESQFSVSEDSEHVPHFDALSDGSHQAENLERMIGGAENRE